MKTEKQEQFYTEKEIAKRLRVTLPTLRSMRIQGKIDFIRFGRIIRYPDHVYQGKLKMGEN
jgi:excisionase family DNA binding protein